MIDRESMDVPKDAIIIFADLIGSSRISDIITPNDYSFLLNSFNQTCGMEIERLGKKLPEGLYMPPDVSIRGEEVYICIVLPDIDIEAENCRQKSVIASLEFAIELSQSWFYSQINTEKIHNKAAPIRIGIGIHYGKVLVRKIGHGRFVSKTKWDPNHEIRELPIGFSINFAKRTETASRLGDSLGITVSQSFLSLCREYGIPVFEGKPLDAELKGFEHHEPVYELIGQDVVYENKRILESENLDLIEKAFDRDPQRNYWLLEQAIETLFLAGSDDPSHYDKAIALAEKAIGLGIKKQQMLWRAAMNYHRRAALPADPNLAISYYRSAALDPSMIWAQYDLAAAYWVNAKKKGRPIELVMQDLDNALSTLKHLIEREPRHFQSYNLRALITAEYAIARNGKGVNLESAYDDLRIAWQIHPDVGFLYDGTLAFIERAKNNRRGVVAALEKAESQLKNSERKNVLDGGREVHYIPSSLFWHKGLSVPAFHPPRPENLRRHWQRLRQEVDFA